MKQKAQNIETLRGIACLLLVAYHVIGNTPKIGMRVGEDTLWHAFVEIFIYIRMPLFAFISGYVYGMCTVRREEYPKFYRNKMRKLGVPLLTVATLFLCISKAFDIGYDLPFSKMYTIYIFPYAHFWYLQASLIIFLIICVLEYCGLLKTKPALQAFLALTVVLNVYLRHIEPNIFAINGAIYLLSFFVLGLYVKRYNVELRGYLRIAIVAAVALFFILEALHETGVVTVPGLSPEKRSLFAVLVSCLSCLALYSLHYENRVLAFIGKHSYAIYLLHFTASAVRVVLYKTGIAFPPVVLFTCCMAGGLLLPILAEQIAVRNRYLRFLLLGDRLNSKKS